MTENVSFVATRKRSSETGIRIGERPMATKPLDKSVLELEVHGDFTGTLRDFFKELAVKVWEEGEGFSGKRPFGNSGWEYPVYRALIESGSVPGRLDKHGNIEECDEREVHRLVTQLVRKHL
jgi:hypothetical protein